MRLTKSDVERALELYNTAKELQQSPEPAIKLTYEPDRNIEDVDRVVVAFGSFDPLTVGHAALFERGLGAAREEREGLEELLIVAPTNHADKKVDLTKNSAIPDRVHALEQYAIFNGHVTTGMTNEALFSGLVEVVEKQYPSSELYFLVGADLMEKIADPYYAENDIRKLEKALDKIFKHKFIVGDRHVVYKHPRYAHKGDRDLSLPMIIEENPILQKYSDNLLRIRNNDSLKHVSSSLVREKRQNGESAHELLADGIAPFVDERQLYVPESKYPAFVETLMEAADKYRSLGVPVSQYIENFMGVLHTAIA